MFQQSQGVGYLAHVAGTVFGFAVTFGVVFKGFLAPERYEENLLQLWGLRPRTELEKAQALMHRYLIEARHPASGCKTQLKISARSEREARNKVIHDGLAVDRITQLP